MTVPRWFVMAGEEAEYCQNLKNTAKCYKKMTVPHWFVMAGEEAEYCQNLKNTAKLQENDSASLVCHG